MYEKYAKLRDKAKLSDYVVAKATGISSATLSQWKTGQYEPKVDKMMKIAAYFHVPLEYFYGDTQQKGGKT